MGDRELLQRVIKDVYGCASSHLRSEHVEQPFSRQTVRGSTVDIFSLNGHARAAIAYAWIHEQTSGGTRCFAMLKLPPIQNASDAVRASLSAGADGFVDVTVNTKSTMQVKIGDDGDAWARWIDESAAPVAQAAPGTMTAAPGQNCAHCDARNRTWKAVRAKDLPDPDWRPSVELTYECRKCGKTTREGRYKKIAGTRFGLGPAKVPSRDFS
jgi:hypothetical protein